MNLIVSNPRKRHEEQRAATHSEIPILVKVPREVLWFLENRVVLLELERGGGVLEPAGAAGSVKTLVE